MLRTLACFLGVTGGDKDVIQVARLHAVNGAIDRLFCC